MQRTSVPGPGLRAVAAAGAAFFALGAAFAEEPQHVYSDDVANQVCRAKCGVAGGLSPDPMSQPGMCLTSCLGAAAPSPAAPATAAEHPKPSADELRMMAADRTPAPAAATPVVIAETGPPPLPRRRSFFSCLWRLGRGC